jgi:hypothetical protein
VKVRSRLLPMCIIPTRRHQLSTMPSFGLVCAQKRGAVCEQR